MRLNSSPRLVGNELAVALSVAVGLVTVGAAVAAARVGVTQGYWTAGYCRLVLASLWYYFDRWVLPAVTIAAGVILVRWTAGLGLPVKLNPAPRLVRAGIVLLVVIGAGRAVGFLDLWLTASGPNVLLISVDTLRADRLGAYGYGRPTSPVIDHRLAAQGVTFESCYSQSPKTTPSHMTMLTSLYPCVHGVSIWEGKEAGSVLNPTVHTLAEVLKNAGYLTAAFTGGGHVHGSRGFGQGFDRYKHGRQLERARAWMVRYRHHKFFLFLHTYAVHDPYVPPRHLVTLFDDEDYQGPALAAVNRLREGVRGWWPAAHRIFWESVDSKDPRDVRFVQRLYDGVIRQTDEEVIAPLLDQLDVLGIADDTLVVFTSDHGEAFGEHGGFLHDDLYRETLRVPLILRFPGRLPAGRRVRQRVRVIDVMPTILDLLGISAPPVQQGRSLSPLLGSDVDEKEAWDAASEYGNSATGRVFESLRHGPLTYIVDGTKEELFDHVTDPAEQRNLAPDRPAELEIVRARLARWRQGCYRLAVESGPSGELVAPSEETLRQLRALGYVD